MYSLPMYVLPQVCTPGACSISFSLIVIGVQSKFVCKLSPTVVIVDAIWCHNNYPFIELSRTKACLRAL